MAQKVRLRMHGTAQCRQGQKKCSMMDDVRDTTVVMEGTTACLHAPCPAAWGWALQCETSQRRGSRDAYKGTGENSQAQHQLQGKLGARTRCASPTQSCRLCGAARCSPLGQLSLTAMLRARGWVATARRRSSAGEASGSSTPSLSSSVTTRPREHEARHRKCADT